MIIIQLLKTQARVENQKWSSPNRSLEKLLNAMVGTSEVYTSDPYPDLTLAEQAIKKLGGEIIKQDPKPEAPEGMIF